MKKDKGHDWKCLGMANKGPEYHRVYQCARCNYKIECLDWELQGLEWAMESCDEMILEHVMDS